MNFALESKQATFQAVLSALTEIFPDSIYPELITEKVIEFAILIASYDVNEENFATHLVEVPLLALDGGYVKENCDFL